MFFQRVLRSVLHVLQLVYVAPFAVLMLFASVFRSVRRELFHRFCPVPQQRVAALVASCPTVFTAQSRLFSLLLCARALGYSLPRDLRVLLWNHYMSRSSLPGGQRPLKSEYVEALLNAPKFKLDGLAMQAIWMTEACADDADYRIALLVKLPQLGKRAVLQSAPLTSFCTQKMQVWHEASGKIFVRCVKEDSTVIDVRFVRNEGLMRIHIDCLANAAIKLRQFGS